MKCPTCSDSTLVMADRAGIEIDYCPSCRGVWLDRGELDKIIDRSLQQSGQQSGQQPGPEVTPAPAQSRIAPADAPRPEYAKPQPQYQQQPQYPQGGQPWGNSKYHGKYHSKYHPRGGGQYGQPYRKRKSSFLGDLFDF